MGNRRPRGLVPVGLGCKRFSVLVWLLGRAARKGGLTFIRARKHWYREARAILASEMDALRAARRQREEEIALSGQYRDIIQRLSVIEARLDAEGANAARGMVDSPGA